MLSAFVALNIVFDLLISAIEFICISHVASCDEQTTSFSFSANEIVNRLEISVVVQVETPQHFYAMTLQLKSRLTIAQFIQTRSCKTFGRR